MEIEKIEKVSISLNNQELKKLLAELNKTDFDVGDEPTLHKFWNLLKSY